MYVDDIILIGNDVGAVQKFLDLLSQRFSLKDLGTLSYFLGVEVTPHSQGLFLCQHWYIMDLLNRAHMTNARPVTTPLATSLTLTLHASTTLSDPLEYRTIVGSLQYLSLTRLMLLTPSTITAHASTYKRSLECCQMSLTLSLWD